MQNAVGGTGPDSDPNNNNPLFAQISKDGNDIWA
jgi:hypothetical protein